MSAMRNPAAATEQGKLTQTMLAKCRSILWTVCQSNIPLPTVKIKPTILLLKLAK
eukprot:CAMPEP_0180439398 /NCGR_PEP_ID=MMETSP1036_2-20121128/12567_1 /TAXON_ID=632150 /ORGANISM="Azadinium spinosum, Strain 3D9" /LENGTH=54 /DNA_ID=CAMNT_0022445535 /DNA_START=688 /DNA_END=852 /DNA_ORIENTATION=-